MTLTPEETVRRIVAARKLRGVSQTKVGEALEASGDFGLHDIARIERGEMHLTPGRRHALSDILSIPEWWFTRSADELFLPAQGDLARIESKLDGLLDLLAPEPAHRDRMRRAEAEAARVRQGSPRSAETQNGPQK
jgi:transcriptional regulator with XRE-family HTH domain